MTAIGRYVISAPSVSSRSISDRAEFERAATGYLVWPAALVALAREAPGVSTWSRIHTRQAVVLGVLVSFGYVALMALPLMIVIGWPSISTGTTVTIYAAGMIADVTAFAAAVVLAFSCASKAARGELFTIPLVSVVADRVFRLRR